MNLKNKTAEFSVIRLYNAIIGFTLTRVRGDLYKTIQQLTDAKIIHSASKKHGTDLTFQVFFYVKGIIYALYQMCVGPQLFRNICSYTFVDPLIVDVIDREYLFYCGLAVALEKIQFAFGKIINAFK